VLTSYNNLTYRIDDVLFNASPMTTFDMKGVETTFVDFYRTKYQKTIRDQGQPMLVSNPKAKDIRDGRNKPVWLVPELCNVRKKTFFKIFSLIIFISFLQATGLTDKMRANFQMMRAMADHTQMDPGRRTNRLMELSRRLHGTPASVDTMRTFNTDLGKELVVFPGRQLPQEQMLFGNNKTANNDDRVDWTNPMKTAQMYTSVPLKRWVFMYPRKAERDAKTFLDLMIEVGKGMNYEMGEPKIIDLPDDRNPTYIREIQTMLAKDPKMLVIVVPNNSGDRYAAIKRLTCVERAVPTQVIVQKTMMPKKGNMAGVKSIATKVMIQINCKLGGAPWMVKFPLKGVMACGFDVTHDTKNKKKSYGAFIASMDLKEKVEFYSGVSAHLEGNEIAGNIELHMYAALKTYKDTHGVLPERIVFYRDGVGDGQIQSVHELEIARLLDAFKKVYGGELPKFSVIIVNKRINTRIFLKQGNNPQNPVSGTIVDTTITLPERYDFFLVSQSVRQGTVAPTSYNIIHDTSGLTPDRMQMLTYKYCHLYYNWSGCTRVPAVVQYAHKLAFLVGEHLHQPPSQGWNNQLYFL
jgi:aubergine